MSLLTRVRQGLRLLTGRGRLERDLQKEVRFHLQMEADQHVAAGLAPDEARRIALRDFGGVDRSTEEVRDARGVTFWDNLVQDVRYGVRSLRRSPGYALAAIVTLGLGIGANTAIFGVVNGVLLHPLPYQDSGRLIRVNQDRPLKNQANVGVAIAEVWDYRSNLTTVTDLVEYHQMSFILLDRGEADRVATGVVSSSYFSTFGVKPLFGRAFKESDDVLGAEPVLVLSNAYWLKHFGGDAHVVGQHVTMNDKVHTIVGILPPIPGYPQENDVYMPTSACPFRAANQLKIAQNRRAFPILSVFARLKPGVTQEQADADIRRVSGTFANAWPKFYNRSSTGFTGNLSMLEGEITHDARPVVWILLATTGLVLLIACANVANLSLSRTLRRDRELALRTALGARRARIIRQLLTEHTIVALAGGILGIGLAWMTSDMLANFAHLFTPRAVDASVDGTVLLFALGVSVVTGLGFGAIPALASRPTVVAALKDGAAQAGDNRRGLRLRVGLVVAQVAVGFALVSAAGLLLESVYRLYTTDLGYQNSEKVLTAEVCCNFTRQGTRDNGRRIYLGILDRATAIPGVVAAAITSSVPQSQNTAPTPGPARLEGMGDVDPAHAPQIDLNYASEDYFKVIGTPLLSGRFFTSADGPDAQPVAVIDQTMAALWKGRDPVGLHFAYGTPGPNQSDPPTFLVVGVVGDVRQYGVDHPAEAQFYIPVRQMPLPFGGQLVLRTNGDPVSLTSAVRAAVHDVDPQVPVENVKTLEALRDTQLTTPRLGAMLLGIFAALALGITLAGLGAVIATTVSQRTREFGVRMALGASRSSVLTMVLRQGAWMVGAGLALGVGGAVLAGGALKAYLYETPSTNPTLYVVVALLFIVAGLLACLGPARRATGIDPLQALRAE